MATEVPTTTERISRNPDRFSPDFMFQLTTEEAACPRSQAVTLDGGRGAAPGSDPAALEPSPFSIAALDVDGDGRLELVLPYFERNAVGILFLDAAMKLRRSVCVPVCQHPWAVSIVRLRPSRR